jgi:hypothetical protein
MTPQNPILCVSLANFLAKTMKRVLYVFLPAGYEPAAWRPPGEERKGSGKSA